MKNTLKAGFGCVDITPPLGIELRGYFQERRARGILDSLCLRALALTCGTQTTVLLSMDVCAVEEALSTPLRERAAEATGLPLDAIVLAATHTHTGPHLRPDSADPAEADYCRMLFHKVADAARLALDDRKPAKMGYGVGCAPHISFPRRYRMRDGAVRTNPGVDNPEILEALGQVDERVNVLRFRRECGKDLILVNFGCHPDTVGGDLISADWPGFLCRTVERALDGAACMFFNGAQGDVNHVNVHPRGGDGNGMHMEFDDVPRGYGHARHMGRVVAGAVLQVCDKVCDCDVDAVLFRSRRICIPTNRPAPDELPEARRIVEMEQSGRTGELPWSGMALTTKLANARRILRLADSPAAVNMTLYAVSLGAVALVGIPGEGFTEIGLHIKRNSGWDLILPVCLANGCAGYFPTQSAYDEGGYEIVTSNFRAGVAELIMREAAVLLSELRAERGGGR